MWAIIKAIGHDGSEIKWPELPEPNCYRGFHPQELIYLGDRFGFITTTFEPRPVLQSGEPFVITNLPFEEIIKNSDGVFTGETMNGCRHAVAWINNQVIDPSDGKIKTLDEFKIQTYYRIKSKWESNQVFIGE